MFKEYRRSNIAEMRELTNDENKTVLLHKNISVSKEDLALDDETFFRGMIARNPNNYNDQWYVNKAYFDENFEAL